MIEYLLQMEILPIIRVEVRFVNTIIFKEKKTSVESTLFTTTTTTMSEWCCMFVEQMNKHL